MEDQLDLLACPTCGWQVERTGVFETGYIVHCAGDSRAYNATFLSHPHHADLLHPVCWSCGGALGCTTCSGSSVDLLCVGGKSLAHWKPLHEGHGAVWGALDALLTHGPLHGQALEIYPAAWVETFKRQYYEAD